MPFRPASMQTTVMPIVALVALALVMAISMGRGCASDPRAGGNSSSNSSSTNTTDDEPKTMEIMIADKVYTLELALDQPARTQGLSGRSEVPEAGGMLFAFPYSQPELNFVMRDCLIPIDIIFLSSQGTIVATHEMAVEPIQTRSDPKVDYRSKWPAQFAIELQAGSIRKLKLQEGQSITLPFDDLVKRAK
jgi:uncharacterized membrane protein (UPF0127 family)